MAVGDIISVIQSATADYSYYQPAAGVEIMVLAVSTANSSNIWRTDGIIADNSLPWTETSTTSSANAANMKWGLTNSIYLGIYASKANHGFSGIQIK